MSTNVNKLNFSSMNDLLTLTTSTASSSRYSKSDIETYLLNPYKNSDKLREISDYFYYNNGIYRNVINTFSSLPTLDYILIPTAKTLDKMEDKAYNTYLTKINNYTDSIGVKTLTRNILKSVARYGGYVGYERSSGNQYTIQTLPINYTRIKYIDGNGDYIVEFNFKYFDKFFNAEDLEFAWTVYPPEFKSLYNAYKADKKSKYPQWQMLDSKKTYCVLFDDDESTFIPMYCNMFLSLLNNEEYQDIIKTGQKLDITKLIVQKIPVDKNGDIQLDEGQVLALHKALKLVLPENVNGLTTPLEIDSVPFTSQSQQKEDLLGKAERTAFVSSGQSSALYADNGGHIGLNMNIELISAGIYSILEKIENMYSRKFKNVVNSKNYEFKLQYFRTTNVNVDETFNRLFKLLEIGGAIEPLFSLGGFDVESYRTLLAVESQTGVKDLLQVPQSMHTQSGNSGQAGSPTQPENQITDAGQTARDLNTNDTKNQSS